MTLASETDSFPEPPESLERSATELSFRLLAESVQDYAIFMLHPSGKIATWNRGAERIKGYQANEIIGQHFSRFYPEEDLRAGKCEMELETAAAVGRFEEEGWRIRKDGKPFWANVVITALRAPDGGLVGFAKVTRDLTERRKAEQERLQLAEETAARVAAELANERLARLQSLTAAIAAARTPTELASIIVERGVAAISAKCGLFFSGGVGDSLKLVSSQGVDEGMLGEYRSVSVDAMFPVARVFRSQVAEWIENSERFEQQYPELYARFGELEALAVLPMVFGERMRGVLAFGFTARRAFPLEERTLMATFAAQAAQALDRAELYEREVLFRKRLEALNSLTAELAAASTTDAVSKAVVQLGMDLAGADTCTLYALNEESRALELIAERGCNPGVLERIRRIPANPADPIYQSVETRKKIWVENYEQYVALIPQLATLKVPGPRTQAFWSLPLLAEGQPIGLLGMGFLEPRRFPAEEREFVETFTRHCTEALLRARRLEAERAARLLAEQLQASLATTLRSIGDAVITTDADGRVTLLNAVAERLTGWTEEAARGRLLPEVFDIVNEQTRSTVQNPVEKVLESGGVVGLANHTLLIAKDGRETPIDDSGAPIRGHGGRIEGVVMVFRDVTERKRAEQQNSFLTDAATVLAESLDFRETLTRVAALSVPRLADWCAVDMAKDGGASVERLGVAHVDPAKVELARKLGERYPPDPNARTGVPNVIRTGRSELYPSIPDELIEASCVDEEHLRLARGLNLRSAMVVPLVARTGVVGAISFVYAESGRTYAPEDLRFAEDVARRCAIAIENAALYAAEQRARQVADTANRAKDEFLATISHELRTPLNAIVGWAKMMASADLDETKTARAIETIERNAIAMAQLIEDLLDVSRIISGKMRLVLQAVEISSIVEAAIESAKPSAEARGVRILQRMEPRIGALRGDPTRLQQVVWNLLSNAVKFTGRDGKVEVVVRRYQSSVEISVQDTGKGIDSRFLPFIFDPFRQEDGSTTRSRGGLGLGLAITRQLVELHGGTIHAESDGEGCGATFIVRLPVAAVLKSDSEPAPGGARQISTSSAFERPPQLEGLRVLVVDDEEDARMLVKAVLEACGSEVTIAGSVDEAMELLRKHPVDVLISDIGMPGSDGYDLIQRVRALPADQGGTVPAAALTAYARAEDRRRVLNAGYSMHIAKPVEPGELVSVVTSLTRFTMRPPR